MQVFIVLFLGLSSAFAGQVSRWGQAELDRARVAVQAGRGFEQNGVYNTYVNMAGREFVQQVRSADDGRVLMTAFAVPQGSVMTPAEDQSVTSETPWVTLQTGAQSRDLAVRKIGADYFRAQSRYVDRTANVRLDPEDGRHLFVTFSRLAGHFRAPADLMGEIVDFRIDRASLIVQTVAGLEYTFEIKNDGGVLSFEAQRFQTRMLNKRTQLAESREVAAAPCAQNLEAN